MLKQVTNKPLYVVCGKATRTQTYGHEPLACSRSPRSASSASTALRWASIGTRAGESGQASERLTCMSRLTRSSSPAVNALTSWDRPGSRMRDPGALVLLGYHSGEPGLQLSPRGRHGSLAVEERYGALKLASVVPQLICGQR